MIASIQRWGDQLAVCIPAKFASETWLSENSQIEMSLDTGKLVISPVSEKPTLEELLAGITPENLHGEWETGPDVGREVW